MAFASSTGLRSFRIAHPILRRSSRFEVTTVAVLAMLAMTLWFVVLPLELALRLTV